MLVAARVSMQGRYSKEQNETSLPLTCQGRQYRLHQKKDKRKAVKWFVTDLSKIPLKDGSMDCILDIFSPAHYKEFQRLLSPNGYVVKVIPTKNHLREIRTKVQAHLKNPDYSNESVVEYFEKYLKTISRETVSATVQLSSEQRMSFIEMTPLLFLR